MALLALCGELRKLFFFYVSRLQIQASIKEQRCVAEVARKVTAKSLIKQGRREQLAQVVCIYAPLIPHTDWK